MKKFKIKNKPKRKYVRHKNEMADFSSSRSITMGVIPSILIAIAFTATYIISAHPTVDGVPLEFDPSSYNTIPGRIENALQFAGGWGIKAWQLIAGTILSYLSSLDPRPVIDTGTTYIYIVSERVSYALLVFDYVVTKAVIDTIYSVSEFLYTLYIAFVTLVTPLIQWVQSVITAFFNLIEQSIRAIQQFFSWMITTIQTPFKVMGQGIEQGKPYLNFVFQAITSAWTSFYTTAAKIFSGHVLT